MHIKCNLSKYFAHYLAYGVCCKSPCSLFPPCTIRLRAPCGRNLFSFPWGIPPPQAYHSAWHAEVLASWMLVNFILHYAVGNKDCSIIGLSKNIPSKHSPGGINTESHKGRPLWRKPYFLDINSGLFEKQKPNTGPITFLVIHCLFVCRVLLRDHWLGL